MSPTLGGGVRIFPFTPGGGICPFTPGGGICPFTPGGGIFPFTPAGGIAPHLVEGFSTTGSNRLGPRPRSTLIPRQTPSVSESQHHVGGEKILFSGHGRPCGSAVGTLALS